MKLITLDEVYDNWYKIKNKDKYVYESEFYKYSYFFKTKIRKTHIAPLMIKIFYNFSEFCDNLKKQGYRII